MSQFLVVNVSKGDDWITLDDGYTRSDLHIPRQRRPDVIYALREAAEKEAARLACENGGEFAVFELVAVVHAKALLDTDAVRGMGPCGAMVPKWQEVTEI